MSYTLEELFPVLQMLTQKYTLNESTSIRRETAQQLMTAILYCIEAYEDEDAYAVRSNLRDLRNADAMKAYKRGRDLVYQKTVAAKNLYEGLLKEFDAYGNQTYYDTIVRGFSAFFNYYDIDFAPQDHILTLDYPILRPLPDLSGINAVQSYLASVKLEQRFLSRFPREHVCRVLAHHYPDYDRQVMNLCSPVLRHALCCMLLLKPLRQIPFTPSEHAALAALARGSEANELKARLENLLQLFIQQTGDDAPGLFEYLRADMDDFAVRLIQFSQLYPDCETFHF
ncbi:DUF6179 domain-containing protein [Anaerovorax odorimutans]|uniref:DUF6179 domain-containing protein n=1 Tax=Anaerovorax odorimutans TaxID=109327 RepID=A0ABT1RJL9_9FIRM|nr:DUF6179 domain-containing protein [Anaerovorax odorimutans]MCQ4635371.1 DUF6179 domain-containing protein [Anaerovorax odorimutans]